MVVHSFVCNRICGVSPRFVVQNVSKVSEDLTRATVRPPEKKRRVWEVLGYSDIKDIKYIKISKSDIADISDTSDIKDIKRMGREGDLAPVPWGAADFRKSLGLHEPQVG